MEILDIYKSLVKETLLFRSFKRMNVPLAILSGIAVLPFVAIYAVLLLVYGAIIVVHKLIDAPADYILQFISRESKGVRHGTQPVMYLIGFPIVLILKFATGLLTLVYFILHLLANVFGYAAMLGGISFYPLILNPFDRTSERETSRFNFTATTVFVSVALALLAFTIIFSAIGFSSSISNYETNKEIGYEAFVTKMESYKNDGTIDEATYNKFVAKNESGVITPDNYLLYHEHYVGTEFKQGIEIQQQYESSMMTNIIVGGATLAVYILLVFIYTPICFRNKKVVVEEDVEEAEVEPAFEEITAAVEEPVVENTAVITEDVEEYVEEDDNTVEDDIVDDNDAVDTDED